MIEKRTTTTTRVLAFDIASRAEGEDGIPVVISTDEVVEVADGPEILVHSMTAIDLRRAPLPIIAAHRSNQVNVGNVDELRIANGQLRGVARFGQRDEAIGYKNDVMSGIIRSVSVGYARLHSMLRKDGVLVTDRWMPTHAAMIAEPADINAGFFRSLDVDTAFEVEAEETTEQQAAQQERAIQPAQPAKGVVMSDVKTTAAAPAVVTETELQAKSPIAYEQSRKQAIINLVRANNLDERIGNAWISQGASMEQVSTDILAILNERSKSNPTASAASIGMENKEVRRYSLMKAIRASASGDWSQATLEHEASMEVAKRTNRDGRTANSFFLPYDVQQRDATVGGTGQYLVATNNQSFIELLRNRMVAYQMGAMRMAGLVGNVTIPKQTVGATAYWLSTETTAITEGNQTFAQLALTPRTVGAYTQISRLLQLQSSPDAESLILSDLAKQVAIAADLAVLYGTGTEQPTGITQTASIGTLASGTSFDYADILEFQTDVAGNNALNSSFGYVTTPAIAALCLTRATFSGSAKALWEGSVLDGMMGGFKAIASNQMTAGTMLAGSWDTCIVGEWGVLELAVNPNDNFAQGLTGLRAFFTMDVGVKYAGAWSYGTSLT